MSNLVITIISIALVAAATIMAIYYGGKAYQQGQTQAQAQAFISQNNQLLMAAQTFSFDNNSTNLVPVCGLANGNYLTTWPPLMILDASASNSDPVHAAFYRSYSSTRPYVSDLRRYIIGYNGGFVAQTLIYTQGGTNFTTDTSPSDWAVQIALAFNQTPSANVASGFSSYMTASGLPRLTSGAPYSTTTGAISDGCTYTNPPLPDATPGTTVNLYLNSNGTPLKGCFYSSAVGIICQQTP